MQIKSVIVFVVILVGLFVLMSWGKVNQRPSQLDAASSPLTVTEKLYDFGTIKMGDGKVNRIFRVTNPTKQKVELKSITTSCMCTTAYLIGPEGEKGPFGMPGHGGSVRPADELIKAGETRDIKVVYDPNAHGPAGVGPVDRFIYLTNADGGTLELEIKALVTP